MTTRARVILTTVIAFVLLLAAVAAGLNAVFTVTLVESSFVTCSTAGEEEAAELKETLDKLVGKSTTFLKLETVRAAVEKYPNFRVETLEKKYPSTVKVSVVERKETFAILQGEERYAILDEDGLYLYDKKENTNRVAGSNILLMGFRLSFAEDELAQGKYFTELLEVMTSFRAALGEIRSNIVSVRLEEGTRTILLLRMREGVSIEIIMPETKPAEKAAAAVEKYLSLGDEERLFGMISVSHLADTGEVTRPSYTRDSDIVD